ncbi:LBP_cg2779 family protein [Apilactobacillus xinyiensis]|uniref:LBP_cg2779 family protein n=1 Tax=Apilactobacillus xinyiensis TaxID=2841032 RepID=UPI00200BD699|nr:LBP_cg2779 family protein [Apilactobacillus xinyiensis]MCL0329593.1 LBP_cg2779 family protein [Apilactobacillus xinyiensis]
MNRRLSNVSEKIVDYQKNNDLTDTQLAFNLNFSVEELHDIKSMERRPTRDELRVIKSRM